MDFKYDSYMNFITEKKSEGYEFVLFKNFDKNKINQIILRHDVDLTLDKALELAKIENSLDIQSTYFILISSPFYNVFYKESKTILDNILSLGHDIGLHFDETQHDIKHFSDFKESLIKEVNLLNSVLNFNISVFSNHRPSKYVLNGIDDEINNIKNAYGKTFFIDTKYISDSNMHWRENIAEVFSNNNYRNFQIGIHPFWYDKTLLSKKEKFIAYLNKNILNVYSKLSENNTNFSNIIDKTKYQFIVKELFEKYDKI